MTGWSVASLCQMAVVRARRPLQDADGDALRGVPAVPFEVKLALEGVVDGFDDLAQRFEELCPGSFRLALAGRAQEPQSCCGQGGLEVAAVVVLVADEDLSGPGRGQGGIGGEHAQESLHARRPWPRSARRRRAGRAGCTPGAAADPRNTASGWRSTRSPARPARSDRVAVSLERPHSTEVESTTQTSSVHSDVLAASPRMQASITPGGGAEPLVIARLQGQVREQVPQARVRDRIQRASDVEPQQRLQHRERDQFRVAELRDNAHRRPSRCQVRGFLQQVIGSHIQCGSEGVQFCRHKRILATLASSPQPSLGISRLGSSRPADPQLCRYGKTPGLSFSLALKAPGFALKAPGLTFSLALKELDLPLIPSRKTLEGAGPVLLTQPSQRPQHDRADDDPLIEAAASQRMNYRAQPDQRQRRLTARPRVPRLRRRPAVARRDVGHRRPPGTLS